MSEQHPPDQPEYLGDQAPPSGAAGEPTSRRKGVVLGGVAVLAVGAVGVGAWGFAQLSGGGPGAAAVLPDTVLGYAAIDLDPSAGQKIEALQTLNKFPAFADEVGLEARDDLRTWFVDQIQSDGECESLDYAADVEPWIGDKLAIAAFPNEETVADPVFALQVSDEGEATDGIAAIFEACGEDDFGIAFTGDYAIVAETEEIAEAVVADAEEGVLADDEDYQAALDAVGDMGVIALYVAPAAAEAFYDSAEELTDLTGGEVPSDEEREEMLAAFEDFRGAAGTVRFADGGIELAFAGKGLQDVDGAPVTPIGDLPGTTVAALGFGLPEDAVDQFTEQLQGTFGAELYEGFLAEAEAVTGLQLPEDLETLIGDGIVVAVDGTTDFANLPSSEDPSALKAGIRVNAEGEDVRRILEQLILTSGAPPGFVVVEEGDGRTAVGFDSDYLQDLLAGGDLEGESNFSRSVAEADRANFAFFVDFDVEDWLVELVTAFEDDEEVVENIRPLNALGISAWVDGDESNVVFRLSTD